MCECYRFFSYVIITPDTFLVLMGLLFRSIAIKDDKKFY